jgi:transposase
LVNESYIPNREQRELRELTRYRNSLIEERAREVNRIQKIMEGANIKLGSVISDVTGRTGMDILKAIVNGITDSNELSKLAQGKIKEKIALLARALQGSVGKHQQLMLKHQIRHIEFLGNEIKQLDAEVMESTEPSKDEIELLDTIPGIGRRSAEKILAEIGTDMKQFRSASHLASWVGLVPRCDKSAGKRLSARIGKGNKTVKTTLVESACTAIRNKDSFYYARYKKIAARRGGKRAIIAIAHSMLLSIYAILTKKEPFRDLGSDYFYRIDEAKIMKRNVQSLTYLGYTVTLEKTG